MNAELAYIANAIVLPGYLDERPVSAGDFYDRASGWVVEAMQSLNERGQEIDPASLVSELKAHGRGEEARRRLSEALEMPVDVTGDFERHIRECARRRRVISLTHELVARCYDRTEDIDRLVAGACVDLEATGADDKEGRAVTLREMFSRSQERAAERARHGVSTSVELSWGHWQLDRDTGGIRRSKVAIVGAQSHWGKSSFAILIADLALKAGKRPLIVSAEDDEDTFSDRWIQYRTKIPKYRFESGILTADQQSDLTAEAQNAEDRPVFLSAIGRTPEWTSRQARSVMRSEKIDLVLFDYLGAWVNEKTSGDDQRLRMNYVSRLFTNLIKTSTAAGVMFSQITPSDKLGMYVLRDSKDIANAAEVVILGLKDESSGDDKRYTKLVKNKPGPAKAGTTYEMGTDASVQCFMPVENMGDWKWGDLDYGRVG